MNKKVWNQVISVGCIFAAGFIVGEIVTADHFVRKSKKIQPLLSSITANIIHKAAREDMTLEELRVYCNEQLNFYNLVVKEEIK